MKYLFVFFLCLFPKNSLAITLGIGTSFPAYILAVSPLYFIGAVDPYGLGHIVIENDNGIRAHLGMDSFTQKYFSLNWRPNLPVFDNYRFMNPVLGFSVNHDSDYQRLTDETRHIDPDINLGTYLVADWLININANIGIAFSRRLPNEPGWEFELGYGGIIKTVAKNLHKTEIRNCFVDDCPDGNNKSGGGSWPDSPYGFYASVAYFFSVL